MGSNKKTSFTIHESLPATMESTDNKCVICCSVLQEPVRTSYGHRVCGECFRYVLKLQTQMLSTKSGPIQFLCYWLWYGKRCRFLSKGFCSTHCQFLFDFTLLIAVFDTAYIIVISWMYYMFNIPSLYPMTASETVEENFVFRNLCLLFVCYANYSD